MVFWRECNDDEFEVQHYDEHGRNIGYTIEGRHYDEHGKFLGETIDGVHYDEHYNYIGETIDNRNYDKHFNQVGGSSSNGNRYDENGYNGYDVSSNEGCFLTTACVEYKGLEDDCYELTTLRNFRDTFMTDDKKADAEEYYEIAPAIVAKIDSLEENEIKEHYDYIYEVIKKCCLLIEADNNEAAYLEYKQMVEKLSVI